MNGALNQSRMEESGMIWLEVARLMRVAPDLIDEADPLFDQYTRGELTAEALLEQLRQLAVLH